MTLMRLKAARHVAIGRWFRSLALSFQRRTECHIYLLVVCLQAGC